jgi:adenylate cyclase
MEAVVIAERFDRRQEQDAGAAAWSRTSECHATVLFVDIQGFTGVAERLPPARLARWLGSWLEAMAAVVRAQGGEVEQVLGDGLMAVFRGHPRATANDAAAAAAAMSAALAELNRGFALRGWPRIAIRIGIATGSVARTPAPFAGPRGGILVGDTVNVAARLEQLDPALLPVPEAGTRILLDAASAGWLAEPREAEPLGEVLLKGRRQPIAIARLRLDRP